MNKTNSLENEKGIHRPDPCRVKNQSLIHLTLSPQALLKPLFWVLP
jgi:hypothetical protein